MTDSVAGLQPSGKRVPKEKRWRGQMPFRLRTDLRTEPLKQEGRDGESSPAQRSNLYAQLLRIWDERDKGKGKHRGSFTSGINDALIQWLKENTLSTYGPVAFDYKFSRHKIVHIVLNLPRIRHHPTTGRGKAGFVLTGVILSIDGLPPSRLRSLGEFAITRIISHHIPLLLEGGDKYGTQSKDDQLPPVGESLP